MQDVSVIKYILNGRITKNERIEELKELIIENSVNENFITFIEEIDPSADGVYGYLKEVIDKELYKAEEGKPLPFDNKGRDVYIEVRYLDEECISQWLALKISVNKDNTVKSIKYSSYWK